MSDQPFVTQMQGRNGRCEIGATTHIALGQTFLMTTLLLAAVILGLVPDHLSARQEGRAALAEAIAVDGPPRSLVETSAHSRPHSD